MILTDREIGLSLQHDLIVIVPAPQSAAYSSTSVDLTLDANIREFKKNTLGLDLTIDPSVAGYNFNSAITQISVNKVIDSVKGYDLAKGELILTWTTERIHLRSRARVAARVEGKSSLARLGLAIHVTAPTIHAGFEGPIQLEVINHGPAPIRLRPGMRICQLIFEQTLGFPEVGYGGQFNQQTKK